MVIIAVISTFNFTPFSTVSAAEFEQVIACWVPPYQFTNAKISYCWNYWQMYKNLSNITAHRNRLWLKTVVPKQTFFPCCLLHLIEGNSFFQSTVFLCFTKVVVANQSSVDKEFFKKSNCSHRLSIYNAFDRYFYFRRIVLSKNTCSHTFECYRHYFRRPPSMV